MKTRSMGHYRDPYVRGPHIRYFIVSVTIAFVVALLAMIGLLTLIRMVGA